MSENHNSNVEFTSNKDQHLKRSLKARHMNMIALGGAIGTGLFVAGGEVVSTAGPGGALVAYGLIGIMVYFPKRCHEEIHHNTDETVSYKRTTRACCTYNFTTSYE